MEKQDCILWLVDIQKALFPLILDHEKLRKKLLFLISGAKLLEIPLFVTEQYPKGIGETIPEICSLLGSTPRVSKTAFSGFQDSKISALIKESGKKVWILAGIETHICIFQSAKDLVNAGFEVIVLRDCVGGRHREDHDSAIDELSLLGIRITTSETLFFELMRDKDSPYFKPIQQLIKNV